MRKFDRYLGRFNWWRSAFWWFWVWFDSISCRSSWIFLEQRLRVWSLRALIWCLSYSERYFWGLRCLITILLGRSGMRRWVWRSCLRVRSPIWFWILSLWRYLAGEWLGLLGRRWFPGSFLAGWCCGTIWVQRMWSRSRSSISVFICRVQKK